MRPLRLQDLAGLPRAIPPGELWRLTGITIDPVESAKTGANQATEKAVNKGKEAGKDFLKNSLDRIGLFSTELIKKEIWPAYFTPWAIDELERQEREKTKKEMSI